MAWVVFYDVRNNANRNRIAKTLVKEGLRVQKSVFWVEGSKRDIKALIRLLSKDVDPQTDSVCAWPLARKWRKEQLAAPAEAAPMLEGFVIA